MVERRYVVHVNRSLVRQDGRMNSIDCQGLPSEIGQQHGKWAEKAIRRSLIFYENLFKTTAKLSWDQVCEEARKFLPFLNAKWPEYIEEMEGISQGASVPFDSVLALNVRTEIAYGLFHDGCTAISYTSGSNTMLAQNWDWQSEQAENLVKLHIRRSSRNLRDSTPSIDMVTEAGIIGKIGLNAAGVGVCLNAVRAKGVDYERLPCHLALRACLESNSREKALAVLRRDGIASSCHILLADARGAVGVEASYRDIVELPMTERGIITHTNHFIKEHPGVEERIDLPDSKKRLKRIDQLIDLVPGALDAVGKDNDRPIDAFLRDEEGYPVSICRAPTEKSTVATLFSITMNLGKRRAAVILGRPSDSGTLMVGLNPEYQGQS